MNNKYSVAELETIISNSIKNRDTFTGNQLEEVIEEIAFKADKILSSKNNLYSPDEVQKAFVNLQQRRKRVFITRLLLYSVFCVCCIGYCIFQQKYYFLLVILGFGLISIIRNHYFFTKKVLVKKLLQEITILQQQKISRIN